MKHIKPFFSENALDRMEHRRLQLAQNLQLDAEHNRFILISGEDILLRNTTFTFRYEEIKTVFPDLSGAIFLGGKDGEDFFALKASPGEEEDFEKANIKSLPDFKPVTDQDMGIIAQAKSMVHWIESNKFCGACGGSNIMANAGWRLDCSSCHKQHFPRTDPVVIMLVTHEDYCLLGHGRDFKISQRYSCLAGFMEPGETVEDAAKRELLEEAGISAKSVRYVCSQPWPFPSTLMIGVHIEAVNKDVITDGEELADVQWVHKSDIQAVLNNATDRGFNLPPRTAVAHTLLTMWCHDIDPFPLAHNDP